MRAKQCLYYNNYRIYGEGLVPVKCIYAPGGIGCCLFFGGVLLVLIHCLLLPPLFVGVLSWVLVLLFSTLCLSSFAIILMGKRELAVLL